MIQFALDQMTEVVIYRNSVYYHIYNSRTHGTYWLAPKLARAEVGVFSTVSKYLMRAALVLAAVGVIILAINYEPYAQAWFQNANISLPKTDVQNITQGKPEFRNNYQPPYDPKLGMTNQLIIPSIGVSTDIQEATYDNYESALKNGVWRVSDFGAPNDNNMPTILAAHRFGYLAWTNLFRRENSFYNLPNLKVGDLVEINWQGRHYVYEVYAGNQGTDITDYSADLILYTCVDLTGPERIFRYARLINS